MENSDFDTLKVQGNQLFKNGDYEEAIEKYKQILIFENSNPTIYFNLALCYKRLENWNNVEEFSNEAIRIDNSYVKSYKLRGEARVELSKKKAGEQALENMQEGISDIMKALRAYSNQISSQNNEGTGIMQKQNKASTEDEIHHSLLLAKKIYYYKEKEYKEQAKLELANYLQDPIDRYSVDSKESENLKTELSKFLSPDKQEEYKIPEFLCWPITLDLMKKPILLSSGHTYEKEVIEKHIIQNGYKDPLTKENITNSLVDNINLRHAIEDFIEKNPWSYKHSKEDNYDNIIFDSK